MKKILNYILVTAILGTFLPYSALAETTNVGVNITGSVSIDVVTTISTNITLDLTTGETTPTYMEIKNNSLVPVNVSITDISASQGAPNQFVKQTDKDWNNLNRDDTEYYVNFNILGEGQNVKPKDILANTEVDLGVISEKIGYGATEDDETDIFVESILPHLMVYEINANFGKNWSSGDKNFTYQITTVYSQAEEYAESGCTMPSTLSSVDNMYLIFNKDIDKTIMRVVFNTTENQVFENQIENANIGVMVNNISATKYGDVEFVGTDMINTSYAMPFSISKLESSPEGTVHYLNVKVMIDNETYSFNEKVIVYNE